MREWYDDHTFRGVVMGSLSADPLKPGTRSGTRFSQDFQLLNDDIIIAAVQQRCFDVVEFLYEGLDDVYSAEDKKMIQNIRCVLDLEDKMKRVKGSAPSVIAQQTVQEFLLAAEAIDANIFDKCERTEMREQYQHFVAKLYNLSEEPHSEKFNSLDIMVAMMSSIERRFEGCEAVMDILAQACVMKSVESVVESWISVLEQHSSKKRNLSSLSVRSELMIAVNGPLSQHSRAVVEKTMEAYWRKKKSLRLQAGHFTRVSNRIKQYLVSEAVDSVNAVPNKTPFMM
jgi:hypothetical protein